MSNIGNISLLLGQPQQSKVYNVSQTHPLIPNSNEYVLYKKYVSIHSEDRDIIKYPNSSEFDIELPEDLLNVISIRLSTWAFPSNYSTFSALSSNINMTFKITVPYNPSEHSYSDPLQNEIFKCLFLSKDVDYTILIEEGFYNPTQMINELTNKCNEAVTIRITEYLSDTTGANYNSSTFPTLLNEFKLKDGYSNFVVVYNSVNQKIWFGNRSDGFTLTNETQLNKDIYGENIQCYKRSNLPDFSEWGLPGNLGLTRCNVAALSKTDFTPRFYYGDVNIGDNGYWLLPNSSLPGSQVYYIECPFKINLMGPSHFYMEIAGQNCMDETSPYNFSKFTTHTNETNGIVNSAFAKISIPTTPISQWFDKDSSPYKLYDPPAERIRKLKFKLRYHCGKVVDFGVFDYTFTLEFTCLAPQSTRKFTLSQGFK